MNRERWSALMKAFGFASYEETYGLLATAYAEKHRHYHTAQHIQACLRHLDTCASQADASEEIELALWFHDAIYKPLSRWNENKSADWAVRFLSVNDAD